MPNELIISIKTDTSTLSAGLADATGQVSAAAASMGAAFSGATTSTKSLAQAQVELTVASKSLEMGLLQVGAAAKDGNTSAQEIIAGLQAEVKAAEEVVAALNQQTAATERTAAATNVLGISARQSATAGIGILEGRMMSGNRAAGAFLTTTLGLGPVLQAAFPIIGALALGEVLIDIGEGLVKFTKEAEELGNTLGVGWLDGAVLQMAGFGEEVKKEEAELVKLQGEADKFISKQKEQQLTLLEMNQGKGAADTARAQADLQEAAGLEKLLPLMQQKLEMQQRIANDQNLKAVLNDSANPGGLALGAIAGHLPDVTGLGVNANPALAGEQALKQAAEIRSVEREIQSLRGDAEIQGRQAGDAGTPKSTKAGAAATDNLPSQIARAQIESANAGDSALPIAARINAEYQKELDLHRQNAAASKEGTAAERETLRVVEDEGSLRKRDAALFTAGTSELKKNQDEIDKAAEEQAKHQSEIEKHAVEEFKRAQEERVSAARDTAEAEIKLADDTFESREREIKFEEELGRVSHRVAAQELIDAENLKASQTTGALRKEQQLFDPADGQKQLQEFTSVENKITAEARKAALAREQITQQETLKFIQQWKKVTNEFNSDFTSAFNSWATHSQTAEVAFGHMFGKMELQIADFTAEWLLKQAEMWAMSEIMQLLGITKQHVKQAASNEATVIGAAGTAAATAAAAAAAGGPPAMAAAAAAAAGTVLAVGSTATFDTGGMLPNMGMAFNRSGSAERILSPSQTSNFESLVNNGGTRSATLHQENHFGGGVTKEMLQDHTNKTMAKLKSMLRPEAFA